MSAPGRRLRKATGALAFLFVFALALDGALSAARPSVLGDAGASAARFAVEGWAEEAAAEDTLGDAAGSRADASARLPDGFAEEVVPADGYGDVRVGADGTVVGLSTTQEPQAAFAEVRRTLVERGWTAVPSGAEAYGSFAKEGGRYAWAFVSCVRTGDTTSVVVQCATTEGKERT